MDQNHTLNKLALAGLMSSGAGAGTLDTELAGVRDGLQLGLTQAGEAMLNAPDRSPSSDVAALNRNKTAVMIANGYQDSLIVPNQLVTFFDQLTGPKRLELRVGDHGGPESSGLTGAANDVWQSATRWLDHYVRGASNGVQSDDPIQLKDAVTGQWHAYKDWASVGTGTSLPLGAASGAAATGALGGTSEAWTRTIATGVDTVANSGTAAYIDKPNFVLPCGTPISRVNRANAAVWTGPAAAQPTLISGEPHLRVNVTSSGTAATFFAYLYDVDPVRGGCLISYAPYTSQSMNPGVAQTVDVDLGTIAWTMPAGHHLALVIDTVDARYANHNVPGTTLTFASTPAAPATFTLPTA
jgi:putative CocE/NonD family hydrolase